MHTEEPETRNRFLFTPQIGYAPAREPGLRLEPGHDFLVVQYHGDAVDDLPAGRALSRMPHRKFHTGDLP